MDGIVVLEKTLTGTGLERARWHARKHVTANRRDWPSKHIASGHGSLDLRRASPAIANRQPPLLPPSGRFHVVEMLPST